MIEQTDQTRPAGHRRAAAFALFLEMPRQFDRFERMGGIRFERVRKESLQHRAGSVAEGLQQFVETRHPHLIRVFTGRPGAGVQHVSQQRGGYRPHRDAGHHVRGFPPGDKKRVHHPHVQHRVEACSRKGKNPERALGGLFRLSV